MPRFVALFFSSGLEGVGQKNTAAFEVFASEKGTWTIMMTMANGMTCIMAAGHSWQNLPKELAGKLT